MNNQKKRCAQEKAPQRARDPIVLLLSRRPASNGPRRPLTKYEIKIPTAIQSKLKSDAVESARERTVT